jgi:hypothetical protein
MTKFLQEFNSRAGQCTKDDLLMAGTFLGFALINAGFAVDGLKEPLSGNLPHDILTKGLGVVSMLGTVMCTRFSSNAFERAAENK